MVLGFEETRFMPFGGVDSQKANALRAAAEGVAVYGKAEADYEGEQGYMKSLADRLIIWQKR